MILTKTTQSKPTHKGKLANTQHVDQLIRHYKKDRWVANSGKLGKPDSLSTWYGMEELSEFLQLARENKADGIKMYFGVYPPDFAETPELRGRQTVVLVATRKSAVDGVIVNKHIYTCKNGKSEILAFNFGESCPPFCGQGIPPNEGNFGIDMQNIGLSIVEDKDGLRII